MSAYNKVNGEWCGHTTHCCARFSNRSGALRVLSSRISCRASTMPGKPHCRAGRRNAFCHWHYHKNLKPLVRRGEVSQAVIDEAVLRILRQKLRFAQVGEPERYGPPAVACAEQHPPGARGSPESPSSCSKTIHLPPVRRLSCLSNGTGSAGLRHWGDWQPCRIPATGAAAVVHPPYVVTPLQGIQSSAGEIEVTYADGSDLGKTVQAARFADAVVVVGYTYQDEGEYFKKPFQPVHGGDRMRLSLSLAEERLILAIARANPKVVVCVITGSAVVMETWRHDVPAILISWYGGMAGGHALGDGRAVWQG